MTKNVYQTPDTQVVDLEPSTFLCASIYINDIPMDNIEGW
jgi:hypothetical protein